MSDIRGGIIVSFGSPIETSKKNSGRFQNFIVFEQSSSRISETDVYLRGEQIVPFFNDLYQKIQQKEIIHKLRDY